MFFVKISIVLSFIACFIVSVAGAPIQETNAQRMARGLPPSPPRFGRALPGMVMARTPTQVLAAKRGQPSSVPPMQMSGRIQVRNPQNKQPIGNVKNTNGTNPISGVNALGPEQDLHVSFTAPPSGSGPFDIMATNAAFPPPFLVGASVAPSTTGVIGLGSPDTVGFTNVQQTPPNSPPVPSSTVPNTMVESAIWSFNPGTNELMAQYVNPDGSKPSTVIAYDIRENVLFFVGDIDAYNKNNDLPASAVKLYLVPI